MTHDRIIGNVTALNMRMNSSPHIRIQSIVFASKSACRRLNPSTIPKKTATTVASSDLFILQFAQRFLSKTGMLLVVVMQLINIEITFKNYYQL